MEQQLTTLETKIDTNDIPTCICEKSMADKLEKECLKCAQNLGGIVAPSSGVLVGIAEGALYAWKPTAITAAKKAALAEATDAAIEAGMNAVSLKIEELGTVFKPSEGFVNLSSIVNKLTYNNGDALVESAKNVIGGLYSNGKGGNTIFYNTTIHTKSGTLYVGNFGDIGRAAHDAKLASETTALTKAKVGAVESTYGGCQTAIIASVVAIIIIALVMIIIYLVLRYRRKKKKK
ncbi:hypothetical protein PFNF54_01302 [Plasmodium falciparum NF54]|uniref:Rifin n=1 Tax=Plasmodium falciparum (isolate NF54) TaxID=5843 RepID=W7KA21_PLAFO|nr:hypothetical protein PFNF54_01302 [Plasmodium falciparum NF54]